MIYFTSDTHFGSIRTLQLSPRPMFKNVKHMNRRIIKNFNKMAKKKDVIYHLGDFGAYPLVNSIKAKVILIMGNYEVSDQQEFFENFEEFRTHLLNLGFHEVISEEGTTIKLEEFDNKTINLTHKPMDCDKNLFNLFGHIHGSIRTKDFGLNVGVDAHFFNLVNVEAIKFFKNAIETVYDYNHFCKKSDLAEKVSAKEEFKVYGTKANYIK